FGTTTANESGIGLRVRYASPSHTRLSLLMGRASFSREKWDRQVQWLPSVETDLLSSVRDGTGRQPIGQRGGSPVDGFSGSLRKTEAVGLWPRSISAGYRRRGPEN